MLVGKTGLAMSHHKSVHFFAYTRSNCRVTRVHAAFSLPACRRTYSVARRDCSSYASVGGSGA